MSYYDDFYEPSEFEQMVEDFKDTLRESVKKEWKDRMDSLEAENKTLQEVRKNFNQIKNDYAKAEWECKRESEIAIVNAKKDAHKARLSELFGDMKTQYWRIDEERIKKPKCDKCDRDRMVAYITPLGKQAKEYCTCAETESKYVPREMVIYQISLNNHKLDVRFIKRNQEDEVYTNVLVEYYGYKTIIKDQDDISSLSENDKWSFYFESEEKCQEYCDWLNNKAELKEEIKEKQKNDNNK